MNWVVMNWVEAVGYLGAALTVAASAMSTMIPLRIVALVAGCVVIVYGFLIESVPLILTEGIQIPFNGWRLWQMVRLVRDVEAAATGDLSMDWLKPFSTSRRVKADETIFLKGDAAQEMYLIRTGAFRIPESGVTLKAGDVVGELGMLSPGNTRTASLVCTEAGEVLCLPYTEVKQLYYQNPEFGFYFLKLTSERLFKRAEVKEA